MKRPSVVINLFRLDIHPLKKMMQRLRLPSLASKAKIPCRVTLRKANHKLKSMTINRSPKSQVFSRVSCPNLNQNTNLAQLKTITIAWSKADRIYLSRNKDKTTWLTVSHTFHIKIHIKVTRDRR